MSATAKAVLGSSVPKSNLSDRVGGDARLIDSVRQPITTRILTAEALEAEHIEAWNLLRAGLPEYRSPFFSPSFTTQAALFLPNVEVALAVQAGEVIAVLPFQRQRRATAQPVGAGINDAHGLVGGTDADLAEMLQAAGIREFPFHAAPVASPAIANYEIGRSKSFLADLTVDPKGYEHFLKGHSNTVSRQGQKTRRMIRELGPLQFEFDCRDAKMLDLLLELKCNQYQRTHTFDILSVPWIRKFIQELHRQTATPGQPQVRGLLSVLYAGDRPVALHFGMIEQELLHYWFPVFDPQYTLYSPGTQLFLECAREAAEQGCKAIDMGYGEMPYKHKLTNVITEMSHGVISDNPIRQLLYKQKHQLKRRWQELSFKHRIKPLARRVLPQFGWLNYD